MNHFAIAGVVAIGLGVLVACGGALAPSEPSPPADSAAPENDPAGGGPNGSGSDAGSAAGGGKIDGPNGLADAARNTDAGAAGDGGAADAAPSCDTTEPFSASIEVPGLEHKMGQPGEAVPVFSDVRLTADELRAVYTVGTKASFGPFLVEVTRPSRSLAFDGARIMNELPAFYSKSHGTFSPDGLVIYFDGNHPAKGVFSAQRTDVSLPFDAPSRVMPLTDTDYAPYLVGTDLWFERMGVTDFHIFNVSLLMGGGAIPVAATQLDALNKSDVDPVVSADGLTVFFARGVSPPNPGAYGTGNAGSPRMMEARRASPQAPFVLREVCELNTIGNERPSWLSPDGCRLYFTTGNTSTVSGNANTVRVASRCAP